MTATQLQKIRHKLGMNTKKFGALLGISPRTVEEYEQGRRQVPDVIVLNLLGECPVCKSHCLKQQLEEVRGHA